MKLSTILLLLSLSISNNVLSAERTWFDEPIKFNPNYVVDAEATILKSLKQNGWEVKEKSPTTVTTWLRNYNQHELIFEIRHDKSQISFNQLSFKRVECNSTKRCKPKSKYLEQSRLNLRKQIAKNIHLIAIAQLLENESIRNTWLAELKTGSVKVKTIFARNLIDSQNFNPYAMAEVKKQIEENYWRKLSRHEVQQYAYFCKLLARSKQENYKELLVKVKDKTKSRVLKSHVKDYLAEMEES